ncbi:unnamed protein product, partial [Mesorhabditis spiculigera]
MYPKNLPYPRRGYPGYTPQYPGVYSNYPFGAEMSRIPNMMLQKFYYPYWGNGYQGAQPYPNNYYGAQPQTGGVLSTLLGILI